MTDCSVDYGPLLGHKSGVVKEILFLGHKKAQIVLNHPVMETHLQVGERSGGLWSNKNTWMAENSSSGCRNIPPSIPRPRWREEDARKWGAIFTQPLML